MVIKLKKNDFFLKLLSKSIEKITSSRANIYFRSSIADENIFGSRGYTVLGIGPKGDNAHSSNEWVSLSSLTTLYKILNVFLKKIDEKYKQ